MKGKQKCPRITGFESISSSWSSALRKVTLGSALLILGITPLVAQTRYRVVILSQYTTTAYDVEGNRQVGGGYHALLWFGTPESIVDIRPPREMGFTGSGAQAISGDQIVGWGFRTPVDLFHALLWIGAPIPTQVIDLNPPGFGETLARGVWNGQQVGVGAGSATNGFYHALLWSGSAESVVDLHPASLGFIESDAYDVWEGQVVGLGATSDRLYALLWVVDTQQVVNLHPDQLGFHSNAWGIRDGQQVGGVWTDPVEDFTHAVVWRGSAESAVDLHPAHLGFDRTWAADVAGSTQVGFGCYGNWSNCHALLWRGSAESVIDLHSFLPLEYVYSRAYGIDAEGQIVGTAYHSIQRQSYAVLWKPLPLGDVNEDGCVNEEDLRLVLADFGRIESGLPTDLNSDGVVNDSDLSIVLVDFGQGC